MHVSVNSKDLAASLDLACAAIPNRITNPILANALLTQTGTSFTVAAYGFDASVVSAVLTQGALQEGSILVPAALLRQAIRHLPDCEVTLTTEKSALEVQTEHGYSSINGSDPEQYPALPSPEDPNELEFVAGQLLRGISAVSYAMARDEHKRILTSIYFKPEKDSFALYATDGHRLAKAYVPSLFCGAEAFNIPVYAVGLFSKALQQCEGDEEVQMLVNGTYISLITPHCTITTNNMEGSYPDTDHLIPPTSEITAMCRRKDLLAAIRQVSAFNDSTLSLEFFNDVLTVSCEDASKGFSEAPVKIEGGQRDYLISLDTTYFREALASIKDDMVMLKFNSPSKPVLINPCNGPDLNLVMPITNET